MRPFEDAQLDHAACMEYLSGDYNFDLLPNTPPILSFDEAAMILSISSPTLGRLVSLGSLPAADVPGDGQYILKSDLIKYIQTSFFHNLPVPDTEKSPNPPLKSIPNLPE